MQAAGHLVLLIHLGKVLLSVTTRPDALDDGTCRADNTVGTLGFRYKIASSVTYQSLRLHRPLRYPYYLHGTVRTSEGSIVCSHWQSGRSDIAEPPEQDPSLGGWGAYQTEHTSTHSLSAEQANARIIGIARQGS